MGSLFVSNFQEACQVSEVPSWLQAGHGKKEATEDSDIDMSDSDDEEFTPPVLALHMLSLTRGANRVRSMPQKSGIIAVWEDSGTVKVIDVQCSGCRCYAT